MNIEDYLLKNIGKLPAPMVAWVEKRMKKIPSIREKIDKEYDDMMAGLESSLKPYRDSYPTFTKLPAKGRDREEILHEMESLREQEESVWKDGFVSGAVYHGDESYIMRALAVGARAYLLKSATDEDLIPAVRAVAAGKPFFSPAVAAVLVEDYVRQLQQRGLTDSYHLLTDREKEVLQLLAEGRSNKEVATLLELGLSTVETHSGNLMQKLNLHSTAELVRYALQNGLSG